MREEFEQRNRKGLKKGAWGTTNDLIFIEKIVLKEAKRRRKNLAIYWVEYHKAYDFSNSKEQISHLLHMDELKLYWKTEKGLDLIMQTVRSFTYDMCMEFGIEKCTIFFLKRGIKDEICDIGLTNDLKLSLLRKSKN